MTLASPHFAPVSLDGSLNARREELPPPLRPPRDGGPFGAQVIRGMPFAFGPREGANVVRLDPGGGEPVVVELGGALASYLVIVHVAADAPTVYLEGFAEASDGNALGSHVSDYRLRFGDGASVAVPIRRRFAIQQARAAWGASAVAAVPASEDVVRRRVADQIDATGSIDYGFGEGEARHGSAFDETREPLWLYALPNPRPDAPLAALLLSPAAESSAVYALTLTTLAEHPLRAGLRRSFRVRVPEGATLSEAGELEGVAVDLGAVLSTRAALDYDAERWLAGAPVQPPATSTCEVLVEVAAHPAARLRIGDAAAGDVHELARPGDGVVEVARAARPVRLRIVEAGRGGTPVPARLHVHGVAGEYLPPRGHHRRVNVDWFEDLYGEAASRGQEYAYVDGECVIDLPLGTVYVEVTRGYEVAPVRRVVEVEAETDELTIELERVLRWRERGWVTADTHVHFLSPQTALLEGGAEGVNVVNLLASQWGEMFSNVGDFDGRTTFGAKDLGGDGEFLVRVGSENRMQVLGHISLLGYAGALIHPLCSGGPSESALGDPLEATMAGWARRCREQGGLVVMPHAPLPRLESAADVELGLVDAIELQSFDPLAATDGGLSPYGLADWYRYLSLGHRIPLVGGSDKMSADALLGGLRTYAQLGERELTYDAWMEAVRAGDTFATIGPLASLAVEGVRPGGTVELPAGGGTLGVSWEVESVAARVEAIEVVVGGRVAEEVVVGGLAARGDAAIRIDGPTWIALRVRGGYHGSPEHVAAHTSAVQVRVGGAAPFSELAAADVLDQIQGAIAYVDTLASRPEARRLRELRASLVAAYERLHQRMHRAGVYHRHPLHDPAQPHEH